MMPNQLEIALRGLPLPAVKFFESTGSTNAEARRWAEAGALQASLVIADEQTAGRGRMGRSWLTPRGAALALSLIFRPANYPGMQPDLSNQPQSLLFSGLGAVAVCLALEELGLVPQIKWPNDVLLEGRKVCGILVEAVWQAGEDEVSPAGWQAQGNVNLPALRWVVIGIGVNVKPASVPAETATRFPATCVEATLGQPVERWELLRSILQHLMEWLPKLDSAEYFKHWESRLAWRNQIVTISASDWQPDGFLVTDGSLLEGNLLGLDALGGLRLALQNGQVLVLYSGEVSLRLKSSQ